ncbi:UNVERIFIED_CONTAM: hypothetical protein PYX00_007405 [Menopon gallinae]|uniref:cholesterol 7-desaturase n=1 Tax=Menopon gallinae TaxID=328185 RepID=A0AAW2HJ30_9NEOP
MNGSDLYYWVRDDRHRTTIFSCSFCCRNWDRGNFATVAVTVVAALFAFLIYYYLVLPLDLRRDLCDVGFDYLTDGYYKSTKYKKRNKRELVREVLRLRKIGDLPPIYPNGWFALIESSDLKRNEVRHVAALGENFAVFRDENGKAHVLDAYCPHLGANMAIGGVVRGNCLECPFHSWRFDGETGECTSVPYSRKTPEFVKVKKWQSTEANDVIFVWYHAEGEDPGWYPTGIDTVESGSWMFQGRSEFFVGCHIQEIPENGADVAHLNAIHSPSLFGGQDLRFYDKLGLKFMKHVWTAEWNQSPKESHKGILSLTFETRLLQKFSVARMNVKVEQIGPGYVVLEMDTSWGPMLLLQMVTPVEPLLQRVIHRMYSPWQQTIFAKFTLYAELVMFGRDVMVWNHKKYLKKAHIVKEDKTIARHRRWYSQFYSDNSPKFSFRSEGLDW